MSQAGDAGGNGAAKPHPQTRAAQRFDIRAPAEYRWNGRSGSGTIWNISASGARIEKITTPAVLGTEIRVRSSFFPGSFEAELPGYVVRETELGGFAIRWVNLGERERGLLKRVLPHPVESSKS
jgi:hypothetical protein